MSVFAAIVRRLFVVSAILLSAACGGGGGGGGGGSGSSGTLSLSTSVLTFNAPNTSTTPPAQVVSATVTGVSSGTLYIKIVSTGPAVASISSVRITGPTTGQATVFPASANSLGSGSFSSTITVTACTTDPNCSSGQLIGTPQTINVTYTVQSSFTTSPGSLYFNYINSGTLPPAQSISVSGDTGTSWTASANQSWVTLSSNTGTTPSTINVTANPAGLQPGTHTGSITFTAGGLTSTVGVSLTVSDPQLNITQTNLTFNGVNGAPFTPQTLNIALTNGAAETWSATSSAGWLVLGQSSGTTPGTVTVNVNPAVGPLASGSYTATINFTATTAGFSVRRAVNVSLNLTQPTFTFSPASISFGGASGRDLSDKTLQISLNTGANAYNWRIGSATGWLQAIPASGSVSSAPATATVRIDATSLTAGTNSGTIVFSAQVNGSTVTGTVPVSAVLDSHKVLVSDPGVAFASTPSLSRLTRTLRVSSNRGVAIGWSATSSQPWLAATASGTTTGDLVLTADPTGLAVDTVHYATVSVSSSEATVQNTEMVRVGLWVGSSIPSATTTISGTFSQVVADPIRPYAYAHNGGTSITVYNVYTGAVVATTPFVAARLADLAVATDGSRLFAVDATNFAIVPVDLPNFTVGTVWPISASVSAYLEYVRSNGVGLVISGNGRFFNASTGSAYSTTFSGGYYGNAVVAASLDGNRLCALDTGISPYTVTCYPLDYTTMSGGQVLLGTAKTGAWGVGSNGQDVAINADGTRVYVASGAPYVFSVYNPTTTDTTMPLVQSLPGDAYPNNAEVARDGRIFVGSSVWYGPRDVWIYNSGGTELASYYVSGYARSLIPRQLLVSGDGLRMITLTDDPTLKFTTVGP